MSNSPDVTLHVYQILEEEYATLHGSISAKPLSFRMPSGDGRGPRQVEATLGWELRLGHLRDAVGLANYLLHGASRPDEAHMNALRAYLLERLGKEVSSQMLVLAQAEGMLALLENAAREQAEGEQAEGVQTSGGQAEGVRAEGVRAEGERAGDGPAAVRGDEPPTPLAALLIEKLNEIVIADRTLYTADRFPTAWLRVSTRELLSALEESGKVSRRRMRRSKRAGGSVVEGQADETVRRLNRLLLEDAFPGYFERIYDIRLAAMFHRLQAAEMSALCLSGGGIRSGTFALGLLQGLARRDLLKQFDYLSTVSGGGYVGSWLTAWLHRHPEGLVGVSRELENSAPASRVDPDPEPVRNLREYSNFITPKTGVLTADTWSFVGIYLRNLLLNWLVFIPLLAAALMAPRVLLSVTLWQPVKNEPAKIEAAVYKDYLADGGTPIKDEGRRVRYETAPLREDFFKVPVVHNLYESKTLSKVFGTDTNLHWRHLLLLIGFGTGVWALAFVIFNRPGLRGLLKRRRPFWYRRTDQRAFVKHCLTWLLISTACLTTYWAWSQEGASVSKNFVAFIAFGVAFTVGAGVVAALVLRKRAPRPGEPAEPADHPGAKNTLTRDGRGAIVWGGAVAGLLFWVASLFDIGNPVVGYGAAVRDNRIIRAPFDWTDWTQWTWWGSWTTELYVCLGVPIFLLIYWAALTTFVGVSSASKGIDDEDREWWARFGAWLLIAAIGWLALTALVIFGPLALLESPKLLASLGGLSGLIAVLLGRSSLTPAGGEESQGGGGSKLTALFGGAIPVFGAIFLAAFVALVSLGTTALTRKLVTLADENIARSRPAPDPATGQAPPAGGFGDGLLQWLTNVPKDAATKEEKRDAAARGKSPAAAAGLEWVGPNRGFDDYVSYITPVVPTLTRPTPTPRPGPTPAEAEEPEEADAFKGAQIVHLNVLHHTSLWFTLLLGGVLFFAGRYLSRKVNLNVFSLHGGYRNRLIRAFLGASRPRGERHPNPFTGFDPADNIHMHELRWALFDEGDFLQPDELAKGLRDEGRDVSAYLQTQGLIPKVADESATADTATLLEALRTELNGVLEREHLYERFPDYLKKTRRAVEIHGAVVKSFKQTPQSLKDEVRSDYHLLLNRLVLEEAFPGSIRPGPPPPYKLMHVVNTSLNLVGGEKLAWQHRKAEPFSVSPLHAGCFRLGYRRVREYGGRDTSGISLGTAATISGAAASSNMGYFTTSPVISLLLTLFNVRLGWWLGNPGPAGAPTYQRSRPESSVTPVLHEAFGMTNDRYEYVYLTDGGHFENLAVYEMVLRRCRFIIAADGAQDEKYRFGDLGNAVRKIRIDLGVPIDFPCIAIHGGEDGAKGMYWAIGRIRYSSVDLTDEREDGLLLYIKPAVYGDEPRDIVEYKSNFPTFPHQSTGDQFFDEPQFESYRALGSHIMNRLCGEGFGAREVKDVIRNARTEMLEHCGGEGLDPDFLAWLGRLAGDEESDAARKGTGDGSKPAAGADADAAARGEEPPPAAG